jgi:hypothetical protein
MAFISDHPIYDALPISNDALDKGGVELLRAAIVDEELFIIARREALPGPGPWGFVLADIVRRLASHYVAEGKVTEAEATAAIVDSFEHSFRKLEASAARYPSPRRREKGGGAKPVKSARSRTKPRVRPRAKPSTKAVARRKSARAKR